MLHNEHTGRSFRKLAPAECRAMLAEQALGRLGFMVAGAPVIVPVNYAMDGDAVVFRTATDSKLDAAVRGARVAFQVDAFDVYDRSGWSVLLTGVADRVTDPLMLERLRRLPLDPWAPGDRPHHVRITPSAVSGRLISPGAPWSAVAEDFVVTLSSEDAIDALRRRLAAAES